MVKVKCCAGADVGPVLKCVILVRPGAHRSGAHRREKRYIYIIKKSPQLKEQNSRFERSSELIHRLLSSNSEAESLREERSEAIERGKEGGREGRKDGKGEWETL